MSTIPGRLEHLNWVLLGGFAALFALGAIFLWKRPVPQVAPAKSAAKPKTEASAAPRASSAETVVAEVTALASRSAAQSLEEMKETLFRLELRRQAGTISEDEYARELQTAQQKLRELLG